MNNLSIVIGGLIAGLGLLIGSIIFFLIKKKKGQFTRSMKSINPVTPNPSPESETPSEPEPKKEKWRWKSLWISPTDKRAQNAEGMFDLRNLGKYLGNALAVACVCIVIFAVVTGSSTSLLLWIRNTTYNNWGPVFSAVGQSVTYFVRPKTAIILLVIVWILYRYIKKI